MWWTSGPATTPSTWCGSCAGLFMLCQYVWAILSVCADNWLVSCVEQKSHRLGRAPAAPVPVPR